VSNTTGQKRRRHSSLELLFDQRDESFGRLASQQHNQSWIGAELTGAHEATGDEFFGDFFAAFRKRAGQYHNRIDAREFKVDRFADSVGFGLEFQARLPASRVGAGTNARVCHQSPSVFVTRAIQQLNRSGRQSSLFQCSEGFFSQQPGGTGMRGVGLGDHWIASRHRCRKVAARNTIESEREIVWAENAHRSKGCVVRTNIKPGVNRGQRP
jgi:hypothetical protein